MKVWITKYALSKGLFELSGDFGKSGKYFYGRGYLAGFGPADYAHTLEVAKANAEALREKRIAQLKKQLAKLEKLEIKVKS